MVKNKSIQDVIKWYSKYGGIDSYAPLQDDIKESYNMARTTVPVDLYSSDVRQENPGELDAIKASGFYKAGKIVLPSKPLPVEDYQRILTHEKTHEKQLNKLFPKPDKTEYEYAKEVVSHPKEALNALLGVIGRYAQEPLEIEARAAEQGLTYDEFMEMKNIANKNDKELEKNFYEQESDDFKKMVPFSEYYTKSKDIPNPIEKSAQKLYNPISR